MQDLLATSEIEATAKANPKILNILNENNLPLKVNSKELDELKSGHMNDTRVLTAKIYSSLPEDIKKPINPKALQTAALLHDYGKALIPSEVLNKNGALNETEREIMNLHSELSYELLKNKNLDEETLNLIRYHHQNPQSSRYPMVEENYDCDNMSLQILKAADQYSALREDRCYREALSKEEALEIIHKDVEDGNLSEEVFNALVKSV